MIGLFWQRVKIINIVQLTKTNNIACLGPRYVWPITARTGGNNQVLVLECFALVADDKALAAIDREVDLNNYMLPLTANLPQARAELALAAGEWQAALTVVDDFVKKIGR